MKTKLLSLALLVACLFLLVSCGDDGVPVGFELASDPARDGFSLYVPDDWSYGNASGVVTAYLSSLSTVNVTATYVTTDLDTMTAYWTWAEAGLAEDFSDYALLEGYPKETAVNDYPAYSYAYTVSHTGTHFYIEQVLILAGDKPSDGMYILTYTASTDENPYTGSVDHDNAYEYFGKMLEYFRVEGKPEGNPDLSVDDPTAPEGMKRANRLNYLGASLFVPDDFRVTLSDGYVGAAAPDGSALGFYRIDYTDAAKKMEYYEIEPYSEGRFSMLDLWNVLQAEYGDYFSDLTVLEEPDWSSEDAIRNTVMTEIGNSAFFRFRFRGTHAGEHYEVTLYLMHENGKQNSVYYLMTYTEAAGGASLRESVVEEKIIREVRY